MAMAGTVYLLLFLTCSVSCTTLDRLKKRVFLLEDKLNLDSSAFRDDIDNLYQLLNESSRYQSKGEDRSSNVLNGCCKNSDDMTNLSLFRHEISRDIELVKRGFSNEKEWLRHSMRTVENNFTRVKRDLEGDNEIVKNIVLQFGKSVNNTFELLIERDEKSTDRMSALINSLSNDVEELSLKNGLISDMTKRKCDDLGAELDQVSKTITNIQQTQNHLELMMKTIVTLTLGPWTQKRFGKSFYYIGEWELNWQDANSKCKSIGARLAEVNSEAENQFLIDISKTDLNRNDISVWLEGSDIQTEGTWKWTHSNTLLKDGYTAWLSGQPSNCCGGEHCLHMWRVHDYEWNDAPCSHNMAFICEKEI